MHWGYWNFPTKNSKILKSVMQCQLEVETGGHRLTLATGSCCPSFLLDCMQLQCFLSCLVILHKILSSKVVYWKKQKAIKVIKLRNETCNLLQKLVS